MTAAREAARTAVNLSRSQLAHLETSDLDAYAAGEPAQVAACRAILEWPVAEFDAETLAIINELTALQRRLCERFDILLETAASDNRQFRKGQQAMQAYTAAPASHPIRTRAG